MNKKTNQTNLICPECGDVFPIMRKAGKKKKDFHRKWLYCPTCQKETNHIEANNLDVLIEIIERKEENTRTEDEQKIYILRKKRSE